MLNSVRKNEMYILILFFLASTYMLIKDNSDIIIPYFTYCNIKINYLIWFFYILPINLFIGYKVIYKNFTQEICLRYLDKKKIINKIVIKLLFTTLEVTTVILVCFIININFSNKIAFTSEKIQMYFNIPDYIFFFIMSIKFIAFIYVFQLLQLFLFIKTKTKNQILFILLILILCYISSFYDMPLNLNYLSPAVNTFDFFIFNSLYECLMVSIVYYAFLICFMKILINHNVKKTDIWLRGKYE